MSKNEGESAGMSAVEAVREIAAELRLGADAVYVAVAVQRGVPLITLSTGADGYAGELGSILDRA